MLEINLLKLFLDLEKGKRTRTGAGSQVWTGSESSQQINKYVFCSPEPAEPRLIQVNHRY